MTSFELVPTLRRESYRAAVRTIFEQIALGMDAVPAAVSAALQAEARQAEALGPLAADLLVVEAMSWSRARGTCGFCGSAGYGALPA